MMFIVDAGFRDNICLFIDGVSLDAFTIHLCVYFLLDCSMLVTHVLAPRLVMD